MIAAPEKKGTIAEEAVYNFVHGSYNCSEAVCAAWNRSRGLPEDTNKGLFSPLAGGIAGRGETCGAITAALMIKSQEAAERGADKKEIRELARKMTDDFEKEFGTLRCEELSRHDCADGSEFDLNHCSKFISFLLQ